MERALSDLGDLAEIEEEATGGRYIDDLKASVIESLLARAVRAEETQVCRDRRVYEVVRRSLIPRGATLVCVRWVDTNKGSASPPKIRPRLVCQECNFGNDPSCEMV